MRYGCCLNMLAKNQDGTGIENIDILKNANYDYVELPLAEMMALDENGRKIIINQLEKANIPCEVCNNFFPISMRLTGENVQVKAIDTYVDQALKLAKQLGVKHIVFGSGKAKNIPDGFAVEKGYMQIVNLLKRINEKIGEDDIIIVIEPLRKQECNLINTFEEGCQLAKDVHGKNIKVLVDFYHLSEEKETVTNIEKYGRGLLYHVHFANPFGRVYPENVNEADYMTFSRCLKNVGYDKRISCEAYADHFQDAAPKALKLMKAIFG